MAPMSLVHSEAPLSSLLKLDVAEDSFFRTGVVLVSREANPGNHAVAGMVLIIGKPLSGELTKQRKNRTFIQLAEAEGFLPHNPAE